MVLLSFPFISSLQTSNIAGINGSRKSNIPRVLAALIADAGVMLKPHADLVIARKEFAVAAVRSSA